MDTKLLEEPLQKPLVEEPLQEDPKQELSLKDPKKPMKTHQRRKFTRTIFDSCPKDIQRMLFDYCVKVMLADPQMPAVKKAWEDAYRCGRLSKHVEHYISFSHRLLRALAQTCRSLHIKIVEYRRKIQTQLLTDSPGRKHEFLRIEKERTQQYTRHAKAVKIDTARRKAYWVKKHALKKKKALQRKNELANE